MTNIEVHLFNLVRFIFPLKCQFKLKMKKKKKLTRVNRIRRHPFPFCDSGQLLAEVNVGQLAAAVGEERQQIVVEVLEVQLLVFVVGAREGDHPAGGTLLQARQEQISEEEVAQVVDSETHAESVIRPIQDAGHAWRERKTSNRESPCALITEVTAGRHLSKSNYVKKKQRQECFSSF